uniref:Carbonic anhydrase n=1 Tax=Timema californicum TaxID=61474 RepID=A0A7R9P7Z6_TIMCA|nr:unnamed protein product [Timema californicum]
MCYELRTSVLNKLKVMTSTELPHISSWASFEGMTADDGQENGQDTPRSHEIPAHRQKNYGSSVREGQRPSGVRNAGNLIPHSQHFPDEKTTTEPAAMELGCIINDIKHIIVCGHSDCKAMNLLHALRDEEFSSQENRRKSPLRAWLCAHASSSLEKFTQLEASGYHTPLIFQAETPMRKFAAYIDPDDKFAITDKLSQINCLQQLQNIASYGFLKKRLERHDLHIHALWFDIYTGDIYFFSRQSKRFVEINENTIKQLLLEVKTYYS